MRRFAIFALPLPRAFGLADDQTFGASCSDFAFNGQGEKKTRLFSLEANFATGVLSARFVAGLPFFSHLFRKHQNACAAPQQGTKHVAHC